MKHGAKWMYVDVTTGTDRYPSDGKGGTTATSASNATAGARWCNVYGVLITTADGSASTVTVEVDDGADGATAMTGLAIPIAASQACPLYIPLGGEDGIAIPGPVAAKTSTANTKFVLFYNKLM